MNNATTSDDRSSQEVALQIALTILGGEPQITDMAVEKAIQGAITAARVMRPDASIDAPLLRRRIEELVTVWVVDHVSLSDDRDHQPWLASERGTIQWRFWER